MAQTGSHPCGHGALSSGLSSEKVQAPKAAACCVCGFSGRRPGRRARRRAGIIGRKGRPLAWPQSARARLVVCLAAWPDVTRSAAGEGPTLCHGVGCRATSHEGMKGGRYPMKGRVSKLHIVAVMGVHSISCALLRSWLVLAAWPVPLGDLASLAIDRAASASRASQRKR